MPDVENQGSNTCPLCGRDNRCASAAGQGQPCWCGSQSFPATLLEKPAAVAARGRCICANCLALARSETHAR